MRPRRLSAALAVLPVVVAVLLALGVAPAFAFKITYEGAFNGVEGGVNKLPKGLELKPNRLAVNEETGDVYVVDEANDAIDVFSASGTYLRAIEGKVTAAGSFSLGNDDDIAIDNDPSSPHRGNIYVVSENSSLVYAFDSSGTLLWESGEGDTSKGGRDVCGVAVDASGSPWVGDYTNGIQELNAETGKRTAAAPLLSTQHICHFDFNAAGEILANTWHGGVALYSAAGQEETTLTKYGGADVAVERPTETAYVVESAVALENLVVAYEWENAETSLASANQISEGNGVTVDTIDHKLYVSDAGSAQIEIFDVPPPATLTVAPAGAGAGSVSADVGAISGCSAAGGTCSSAYREGTVVKLHATEEPGSRFAGWSGGGCSGTSPDCEVTMMADTTVTATFEPVPTYALTVTKAGSGAGTVTSAPAGIDCGSTCAASFEEGAQVTLTAAAGEHSTFTGWSGACTGTASTCKVTMSAAKEAVATFAQDPPAVTTGAASGVSQTAATLSGTVNPDGAAVSACEVQYGTSAGYGLKASCASLPGSGASPVAVSVALSGLTAGTTYHYRFVATNPGGTVYGADATFTTAAPAKEGPKLEGPPTEVTPVPGVLGLGGTTSVVKSGKAPVKLTCTGGTACAGTVKITIMVKKGKHKKTITAGSAHVNIPAGQTVMVSIHLTGSVQHLLAKRHKLSATLTGPGLRRSLLLKAGKVGRKRGK
jgi:Divergent InlB B-repeat domain